MKKIYTIMMISLMAIVVIVMGCKREHGIVTLGANIDNGRDAKVYIDDLTPCWHNNDLIRVNNQTCTTSAALGSSAQLTDVVESNYYRAIYPADVVGNVNISSNSIIAVTLPREQQYEVDSRGDQKVKVPMGAYSSNESLTFHNLCSMIKVVISSKLYESFPLEKITVTAGSAYLSGQGNAMISGYPSDFIEMISSSANHDVSLVFTSTNTPIISSGDRNTYVFYIVVPEFAVDNVTITLYSQGGNVSFVKQGVSLPHNKIAQVSLTVEQWTVEPIEGSLPGVFSISDTRQVCFSKGNLQYQASTNTWRFAANQWYFVGGMDYSVYPISDPEYVGTMYPNMNDNISSTYSGWIDLFGWGTSGWSGSRQPWDYEGNESGYRPSYNGSYLEADWAWHNAISNGGNAVHVWRTLTSGEWYYLINYRRDASLKIASGRVNWIGGLIILPDNWTLPEGCIFMPGFATNNGNDSDWTHNNYNDQQWRKMEKAGAVFLPAAGIRYQRSISRLGLEGYYWAFTPGDEDGWSDMSFSSYHFNGLEDPVFGNNGLSVRPVRDIN